MPARGKSDRARARRAHAHALSRALGLGAGAVLIAISIVTGAGSRGTAVLDPASPAYRGLERWRQHDCGTCHAVFGLGGHLGPDLTNVMRRRNEAFVRYVLHHGAATMPRFELDAEAAGELIAYLRHLDGLGTYPLDSPDAPSFGIAP